MRKKWKEKIRFIIKRISRKWNFIQNFNKFIFFKFNSLVNEFFSDFPKIETLSRKFGNELFRKKNLHLAIEFYSLSLSIVSLSKKTERSFCFSNRAQCLLGLNRKEYTLTDCSFAIKLDSYHEKSWCRKNFVYNSNKDYIRSFFNFLKMNTLSRFFGKFFIFTRIEPLSKLLTRFERILSKEKYWKKLRFKKKTRYLFFSKIRRKNDFVCILADSSNISVIENLFLIPDIKMSFLFKIFSSHFLFLIFSKNLMKLPGITTFKNQNPTNLMGLNFFKISYQEKQLMHVHTFISTKITNVMCRFKYFKIKSNKIKFLFY